MSFLYQRRLAQVGMFILVGLMTIFLMGFLIFNSVSEQEDDVKTSQDIAKQEGNQDLQPIKQQVDFCLGKQLRRATIIAGIRGGYIYDQGEYYFSAAIPDGTYSDEYITNMDLNWNNLLFSTLAHYQTDVYTPYLDRPLSVVHDGDTKEIYNRGIKEDFERFIREQFLECMRMERYQERGLNVTYEEYVGNIASVSADHTTVTVGNLEAEAGDNVSFGIEDSLIEGYVDSMISPDTARVSITNLDEFRAFAIENVIGTTEVLNRNATTTVNVTFSDESITADLKFPVRLKSRNRSVTFDNTQVSIPVRFKKLLDISEILLYEKYRNRSLDYSNPSDVEFALQGNRYLSNSELDPFKIVKSPYNNSQSYKRYVYSIVDNASRIQGNPYVFNFGYENRAPELDTSALSTFATESDGSLMYVLSEGNSFTMNLSPQTSDEQIKDNYFSYFEPFDYNGPDGEFRVEEDGEIFFRGTQKKRYEYDVTVTDRGAQRSYTFIFLTSFPENKDNSDSESCFRYKNYGVESLFPINDELDNKLFTTTGPDGKEKVYGFYLYSGDSTTQGLMRKPELRLRQSCFMSLDSYDLDVSVTSGGSPVSGYSVDDATITLPLHAQPMTVKINVVEPTSGTAILPEPYEVTLYPAACLGPGAIPDDAPAADIQPNCCNVAALQNAITNGNPKNFYSNSNIDSSGTTKTIPSYFCFDMPQIITNPDLASYEEHVQENVLWDSYGTDATSLYEGNVKVVCDGSSAVGNIDRVAPTGSTDFSDTAPMTLRGNAPVPFPSPVPVQLTKVIDAGECEFCGIGNVTDMQLLFGSDDDLAQNYMLQAGPKMYNTLMSAGGDTGVGPQPNQVNTVDISDTYIKCSEQWYGRSGGGSWIPGLVGLGGAAQSIEKSQGFCQIGSATCAGREDSPGYESNQDSEPACIDYYHTDSGEIVDGGDPTGWVCGECWQHSTSCEPCECDEDGENCDTCCSCSQSRTNEVCQGSGNCVCSGNGPCP